MERHRAQPIQAGLSIGLIGYTSSFAVVLAGLRTVGATSAQATSGLIAVAVASGLGTVLLSRTRRIPITLAWSTPGAAVLASSGHVSGGWPAAIGAFAVVGALICVTGLWPRLGRLVGAIPAPIAQAMLAGVVLQLCLVPGGGLALHPAEILPILAVWLLATRLAPRWATPAAFAAMLGVVAVLAVRHGVHGPLWPHPRLTAPRLSVPALLGIALPLYVVTMAGQNVPGVAIMRSFGYAIPWREALTVTGVGTLLGAPFGGHAINLAAISAAVPASAQAHPDPARRWPAATAFGVTLLGLGALSTALVTYLSVAPEQVVATIAGVGLLPTLGMSLVAALESPAERLSAAVTLIVAASGVTIASVAAPTWALLAGLVVRAALRPAATAGEPAPPGRGGEPDGESAQTRRATNAN